MRNTTAIRILSNSQAKQPSRYTRANGVAKRLLDLFASAIGLILLSPLFILIAWRIRRDSPGPIFYYGHRVGKEGKNFKILKFRSMRETPESYQGPRVTAQDDPRVTPIGRWLRDNKLNELPQLWNVLIGEMSLVGPRPEDPLFADSWPKEIRAEILSVRPGITSPASVLYRDEEALLHGKQLMDTYLGEILPSKLRLDQLYVRHRSFWGDLDIIFWTLLSLIPQMRHQKISEPRLFAGPLAQLMHRYLNWFFLDILITLIALALAGLFWRTLGPLHVGWYASLVLALSFATLFSVTNVLLKTNQVEWSRAAAADVLDLIPGMIISLCAAILLNNLLPAHWVGIPLVAEMSESEATPGIINIWGGRSLLPNGMLVLAAGLAVFGFIITRYRSRLITGIATRWIAWRGTSRSGVERALIIGGGNTGQYAAWMLQNGKYSLSLHVVGFVDDSLYMQETRIHGLNVLGRREDIPALVDELDIGILVFAIHNISPQERQDLIDICHKTSARVFEFPDIPNAIRQVSRSTGPHNGSKPTNHKPRASKPSTSQTSAIPSEDLDRLLARLEQMLESGDTSETLAEIQQMRRKLYDENPTIQTAHVSSVD